MIENAAKEPEVGDLAAYLRAMGAEVGGAGTSRIEVEGVEELHPAPTPSCPTVWWPPRTWRRRDWPGARSPWPTLAPTTWRCCCASSARWACMIDHGPRRSPGRVGGPAAAADVATLPYPGVATDYSPLLVAMLTVADGVAIVTENLFSGRFRYIDELRRMGADISTEGHHAVVRGVPRLSGAPVRATDIRAGAALVLAGLVAEGETVVTGAHHIGRGYEDLAGALRSLGAKVSSPVSAATRRRRPGRASRDGRGRRPGGAGPPALVVERGGSPGQVAGRASPTGAAAVHGGTDRCPRGRQVDHDRPAHHRGPHGVAGRPTDEPAEAVDQVAVLAVDPTSPFSGRGHPGRPCPHAAATPLDPTVFIRSMATRGHLGGLALAVPDAVRLLGAAGLPVVIVETVGVGQMEVEVASAADTTVVVVTPGLGGLHAGQQGRPPRGRRRLRDQQGRPAGRARGAARPRADARPLGARLGWRPPIVETVAADRVTGLEDLWAQVARPPRPPAGVGPLETTRAERLADELRRVLLARSVRARVDELAGGGGVRRRRQGA